MSSRVYIGRLSSRASEKDVEHFFRGYGRIRDVILKAGYGFVEFDDSRDADDAIYDLNGKDLAGERVLLEFSKRKREFGGRGGDRGGDRFNDRRGGNDRSSRFGRPHSTRYRMIVENLSSRVSWQDLKDLIRKYGCEVTFADAHKAKQNEGIVCFETHGELKRCMEKMQGEEINGRKIKLIDDTAEARSRSRSRSPPRRKRSVSRDSRSRSRSSRRSRSRSASKSKSRSRSPPARKGSESPARKRSQSPAERSPDAKRKRSESPAEKNGRSRSVSPEATNGKNGRSRSASPRERSASPAGSD